MKMLTLLRHAKSSWSDTSLSDFERPLKKRGVRDAPLMGQVIGNQLHEPDLILVSPSQRTTQTAKIIIQEAGYSEDVLQFDGQLYHGDSQTILHLLTKQEDHYDHIFVVGHNPGITDCLNELTSETIDNVPTCGIGNIRLTINGWQEIKPDSGYLAFYDIPKNHKKGSG